MAVVDGVTELIRRPLWIEGQKFSSIINHHGRKSPPSMRQPYHRRQSTLIYQERQLAASNFLIAKNGKDGVVTKDRGNDTVME